MTRGATTRRLQFLPHRFVSNGLTLIPERCVLDSNRDVGASFDAERHLVDLSGYRFQRVRFVFDIELRDSLLAEVFPAGELKRAPASLLVVAHCPATRLRRGHVVGHTPIAGGRHHGTIELAHDDIVGGVLLTPLLVRGADRRAGGDGFATANGSRLAAGRAIDLRVETLRAPTGEHLDVRYESFKTKGPPQFPHVDALYQLECDGEAPILWLNSDHDRVCAILDDGANVGRRARMREVVFDQISHAVWLRLFLRAARDVAATGEPLYDWQDAVLSKLLPLVYPDVPDPESRLAALRTDVEEDNEQDLIDRLDGGLQEHLEIGSHTTALAEELA